MLRIDLMPGSLDKRKKAARLRKLSPRERRQLYLKEHVWEKIKKPRNMAILLGGMVLAVFTAETAKQMTSDDDTAEPAAHHEKIDIDQVVNAPIAPEAAVATAETPAMLSDFVKTRFDAGASYDYNQMLLLYLREHNAPTDGSVSFEKYGITFTYVQDNNKAIWLASGADNPSLAHGDYVVADRAFFSNMTEYYRAAAKTPDGELIDDKLAGFSTTDFVLPK